MLSAVSLSDRQRRKINLMPRSAPTVDGSPNLKKVSMTFVDRSNDQRSVSMYVEGAATAAQIEGLVAAAAAASNANIFRVEVSDVYNSPKVASQALAAEENSVYDNIVLLMKESDNPAGMDAFLPAPKRALFVGDSDNVDNVAALYTAWRDAAVLVGLGTLVPISVRYTERREKNEATSATQA